MCKRYPARQYNHLLLIASFNTLPYHNVLILLLTIYFKHVNKVIRSLLLLLHYKDVQKNCKIAHVTTSRPADRYNE